MAWPRPWAPRQVGLFSRLFAASLVLDGFVVGGAGPSAVVLLGPSGSGKSQTGNTLLDSDSRFNVSAGLASETRKPQAGVVVYEGREWQVVDTPGYLDTSLAPAELDDLLSEFADVVSDHIVALVFVVPFGRFGDAHMRAWRLAQGAFGGSARKYTALAFTLVGDRSEDDVRAEITKVCTSPEPPMVCTVVGQLEDPQRVLAFGNLEPARRGLDRSRLFELAASMETAAGGRGYNHGDFLRTRARRKLLAKRVEKITVEEDRRLLGLLLANVESGAQTDEELLHALERAEGLGETRRIVVDFEDRTLGPFYQVGSGWRQPMPVPYDSMKGYRTASGDGATLFLHTGTDSGVRLRHGDKRSGELRSRPFFLGSGEVYWEGAGSGGFVALCPADRARVAIDANGDVGQDDGSPAPATGCLEKRLRRESTELIRGGFDEDELLHLRGSPVFLRIVDDRTAGWGFIALDNLVYPSVVLNGNATEAVNDDQPAAEPDTPPASESSGAVPVPESDIGDKRRLVSEDGAEQAAVLETAPETPHAAAHVGEQPAQLGATAAVDSTSTGVSAGAADTL